MRMKLLYYAILLQETVRKRLSEIYSSPPYNPDRPTDEEDYLEQINELSYSIFELISAAYPEEFPETEIEERN